MPLSRCSLITCTLPFAVCPFNTQGIKTLAIACMRIYLNRVSIGYIRVQSTYASMIESIVLRTQIAWEYIYSYPLPVLAHTVASLSGNGTAVNTFYSKSNHLSVPADNSLTPNHDTIYSQAELDLSQVMGMSYMCTLASCVPMYCACEQDAHSGDLCCHCSTFECRSMLSNTHDDMLHPCTDVTRQASFAVCCMQGPQIVTVPQFDVPSRYWIVPFLDAYLNYYGAIGSDFNSTPGQYLVVGRSKGQACTPQAHCSQCHEL